MNNFKGILLMLIAMAGFTMEDLFMKKLSVNLSTGQILITLGFGSSLVFALMAKSKGYKLTAKIFWSKGMLIRQFAEGIAAIAFITSLTLIPLSTVAAVFQATPLVITMGAALFLGEAVGWRRWLAIIVGLIGVLIIIRPGLNSFDPNVGYVLIAVLFVDKTIILENWGELIELDENNKVKQIRYSTRLDYVPALEKKELEKFYQARKLIADLYASSKFEIKFKLKKGDLLMMDNHRLLHGRTSYDTSEGNRYLKGCYIDHDSTEGKLRHLERKFDLKWKK